MKKRIFTVLLTLSLTLAFLLPCMSPQAFAGSDPLELKSTYYTAESDYIPGDCILTATRMMIIRAAIMHGKTGWSEITNEVLRPVATVDGCLQSDFRFESEGITYRVGFGTFSGEDAYSRIAEIEYLLRAHPEGIVVHGDWAASSGMHGVLAVKVENGQLYAMDASYNMGIFSEGIQKWEDTSMLDPVLVTRYWYISEIYGTGKEFKLEQVKDAHINMLRAS